jgi:restriction endonuclease S subunit
MNQILHNWDIQPLSELVDAIRQQGRIEKDKLYELWSIPSFSDGRPELIEGKKIGSSKLKVEPNDILISKINPRINRVWMVEDSHLEQLASPEWLIARVKDSSQLDKKFLRYYLSSPEFREWISQAASSVTGSHSRAKSSEILQRNIPLPPLPEQQKIVEILEDHLSRLDAALADVKQAKLKAAQFHKSFIHNMTTSVESSEVMNILEICDVYQPKTISTKELIPDGAFPVYGANGQIGFYDKFNHEESEVTVTCRGATCGTVNVIPAMSWITGNAMVFTPKDNRIQKGYLEYVLRGMDWTPVITGTAQPQITRNSIKDIFVDVPNPEIQNDIYMKLESALTQVSRASLLSEVIEAQGSSLRRSLLQAAFTGQLTKEVASA